MYWNASAINGNSASLDKLIDKGMEGLDELLDQDSIIMRCRTGDAKLLGHLSRPEVLERLFDYSCGQMIDDAEKSLRFPLLACELLHSEHPAMWQTIERESGKLFPCLWRPLALSDEKPQLMGPAAASWVRLLHTCVLKIPQALSKYFELHPETLDFFLKHLSHPLVCEAFLKILTGSYISHQSIQLILHQNIAEDHFIGALLEKMSSHESITTVSAVKYLLFDLIDFPFASLQMSLFIWQNIIADLDSLLRALKEIDEASQFVFVSIVDVICFLTERIREFQNPVSGASPDALLTCQTLFSSLDKHLCSFLSDLLPFFISQPAQSYNSPSGSTMGVGSRSIYAARLIAVLSSFASEETFSLMHSLNFGPLFFDALFANPSNNLLHGYALFFLRSILRPSETGSYRRAIAKAILVDGKLTKKILKAERLNGANVYYLILLISLLIFFSFCSQKPRGYRLNYIGHVTAIVDELLKYMNEVSFDEDESLKAILKEDADWNDFVEGTFREWKLKSMFVLGGSKAPVQPTPPAEEISRMPNSLNAMFPSVQDEQLARYFCNQVLSSLPNKFVMLQQGEDDDDPEDYDDYDEEEWGVGIFNGETSSEEDGDFIFSSTEGPLQRRSDAREFIPGIQIPVDGNGIDNLQEMEERFSKLVQEQTDLEGETGSEDATGTDTTDSHDES